MEFRVVDDDTRSVTVYSKTGIAAYGADQSVPVPFADGQLSVADILE